MAESLPPQPMPDSAPGAEPGHRGIFGTVRRRLLPIGLALGILGGGAAGVINAQQNTDHAPRPGPTEPAKFQATPEGSPSVILPTESPISTGGIDGVDIEPAAPVQSAEPTPTLIVPPAVHGTPPPPTGGIDGAETAPAAPVESMPPTTTGH